MQPTLRSAKQSASQPSQTFSLTQSRQQYRRQQHLHSAVHTGKQAALLHLLTTGQQLQIRPSTASLASCLDTCHQLQMVLAAAAAAAGLGVTAQLLRTLTPGRTLDLAMHLKMLLVLAAAAAALHAQQQLHRMRRAQQRQRLQQPLLSLCCAHSCSPARLRYLHQRQHWQMCKCS
jgi:16S rRNA G1207 methylase RsmC